MVTIKLFLSLVRNNFAVGISSRAVPLLVGPYVFLRRYYFDAYGPHTGPFLLWFSKKIARGPYGPYDKVTYLFSEASERSGYLNPRM